MHRATKTIKGLVGRIARVDRLWSDATSIARPGVLACRAGCFGCCVGLFEISAAEALVARAAVARLADAEREDVIRRAESIAARTADRFPGDVASGVLDPSRSESDDDAYFDLVSEIPCPMLELPSGRCRIYEYRPITCRTYGLAWARGAEIVHPPCGLNLVGSADAEKLECSIDLDRQNDVELDVTEALAGTRLGPQAETTLAHAVVGRAFEPDEVD